MKTHSPPPSRMRKRIKRAEVRTLVGSAKYRFIGKAKAVRTNKAK